MYSSLASMNAKVNTENNFFKNTFYPDHLAITASDIESLRNS